MATPKRHDLVVLGAGTAGLIASLTAAGLGARVALVEADRPGGDCLWTGCVPSKSLIASAKLAHDMRTAERLGLEPVEPRFDFAHVMERIESVIEAAGERDSPEYLTAEGVELVQGEARFEEPGAISVDGRRFAYRAAVIATGSRPSVPPVPGLDSAEYLTNETVWSLRERPERLVVIGGGPIGVELGQAFARLGSRVEVVETAPRLLPREEPEASEFIEAVLRSDGVLTHTGAAVERVTGGEDRGGTLHLPGGHELAYDRLLVAAGRRPITEGLGLERVGVETTPAGAVRVDEQLRTTGDRIYAAGDVVGQLYFTHVAGYHGLIAAANALFRARQKADHSAVPWVTFTDPEVARVGLTEEEARARLGRDPLTFRHDYSKSDRALTAGEARGFAKLVSDRRGRLLGATIAAPSAGESVAEVARLVRDGKKVGDLSQMIHAYPTFTEGPARAADDWWRRRYFTPSARRYFRPLLAVLRAVDRPRGR